MSTHPSPLETIEALYLAKIAANQEEIIKMLAEIISKGDNAEQLAAERIMAAANRTPELVNDFLNRVQREAMGHSPLQ